MDRDADDERATRPDGWRRRVKAPNKDSRSGPLAASAGGAWLAVALLVGLVGAFVALALAVEAGNAALAEVDARARELLGGLAGGSAGAVLSHLSALHAPRGILALTAAASVALWLWHRRTGSLLLVASVLGGALVNHALKHGFQRPRPGLENALSVATDFSFPSGHAAEATLLYGTLAALIALRTASWPLRVGAVVGATVMVLCIGGSRVMLGAHHLSDVIAGVLVGLAWMTLCLALRNLWRRDGRTGR